MSILQFTRYFSWVGVLRVRLLLCYVFLRPRKILSLSDSASKDAALEHRYANFFENHHVLIVDDQDICCNLLSKILSVFKFKVHIAHDGISAIECLKENKYSLVIMDLQMPKMDGVKAARAIRNREFFIDHQCSNSSNIPIVACTSLSEQECLCLG